MLHTQHKPETKVPFRDPGLSGRSHH